MKILRLPQVIELVGLKRSAIYQLVQQGKFPRPVRLSKRAVGWRSDEIEVWIESRVKRDN